MGAGKTTLGKIVAQEMNLSFIDLDIYIENRYHKTINDIFREKGEEGFRLLEREALKEVSEFEDVVVATGGGAPCFFDNAELMNQRGVSVYLKTDVDVLFNRLKIARHTRPILREKTDEELILFIADNLQIREPFYQKALVVFDANRLDSKLQIQEAALQLSRILLDS